MPAFQTSIGVQAKATPGLVVDPDLADISSNMLVEPAAGIGPGLVVSRGTDVEKQVDLGGADVFGITIRWADLYGPGYDPNTGLWKQYAPIPCIHTGYVWVEVDAADTGDAGSRAISCNNTTGQVVLGAAGAGEQNLLGCTLMNTVGAGETLALLRLNDIQSGTEGS
jgi:hypothetical protein